MNQLTFEEINETHLGEVTEIYNYYVRNTTVSFDIDDASLDQMKLSVMNENPRYKSFVIYQVSELIGYVLLTQYKKKQAYDICGEVTIYLKPDCIGGGIGRQALHFIEQVATQQGFKTLVTTICSENERSLALFDKHGYTRCALYKEVAVKFNRSLDIVCHQKIL